MGSNSLALVTSRRSPSSDCRLLPFRLFLFVDATVFFFFSFLLAAIVVSNINNIQLLRCFSLSFFSLSKEGQKYEKPVM